MIARILAGAALGALASTAALAADDPTEAAFRATYKELVETNTTVSNGSCTLAAQRMGARLKAIADEDSLFYHVIRDILVAHLHGNAAQVSVEIGRGSVPSEYQPSFQEMEASIGAIPPEGA